MPRRNKAIQARQNKHAASNLILERLSEEDIVKHLGEVEGDPFVLVLDRVQDPHNLGACMRTANAAGCHLVIAPRDRASSMTETARRIACGGADDLPYVQVTNLGRTLDELKEAGLWIVGTGDEEAAPVYGHNLLNGPLCFIMGAEGAGIRAKTASKCDALVRIPMLGSVECLNVSVATGVCLFEAVRQRLEAAGGEDALLGQPNMFLEEDFAED
ncbi:MAG: 23S rRNA (guanosine(2251)-2'-O)-methyltransferase RlmB [Opitutales bacterium]